MYQAYQEKKCDFCDPSRSFGNEPIFKEDGIELFIAKDLLRLLRIDDNIAENIKIKFCPMCGRRIYSFYSE